MEEKTITPNSIKLLQEINDICLDGGGDGYHRHKCRITLEDGRELEVSLLTHDILCLSSFLSESKVQNLWPKEHLERTLYSLPSWDYYDKNDRWANNVLTEVFNHKYATTHLKIDRE